MSDTNLKWDHPRTIPAKFGLIWFNYFGGENLDLKVYDVQWADDRHQVMAKAQILYALWQGEPRILHKTAIK